MTLPSYGQNITRDGTQFGAPVVQGDGGAGVSAHNELSGVTSDQHHAQSHAARHQDGGADELDLYSLDFLVGTATGALPGEIVAGTAPAGELGGTWASPTVDASHSGSTHAAIQSGAEAAAAASAATLYQPLIPRVGTVASSATPTPTASLDLFTVTALAEAAAFAAPTGSPVNGQKLVIRVKDNGTARALSWNAIYRAGTDVALPTTTVISKTLYLAFMFNSADTKWDLLATSDGF